MSVKFSPRSVIGNFIPHGTVFWDIWHFHNLFFLIWIFAHHKSRNCIIFLSLEHTKFQQNKWHTAIPVNIVWHIHVIKIWIRNGEMKSWNAVTDSWMALVTGLYFYSFFWRFDEILIYLLILFKKLLVCFENISKCSKTTNDNTKNTITKHICKFYWINIHI